MAAKTSLIALFLLVCGLILSFFISNQVKNVGIIGIRELDLYTKLTQTSDAAHNVIPTVIPDDYDNDHRVHYVADVNKKCRWDTGTLIQSMRTAQKRITKVWRKNIKTATERWEVLPELFDSAANGFKLLLRPFKCYSGDENKYFLEFSDPNSICHHITIGVGGVWDGEKALRKKYPQCEMVGVDPSVDNKRVVESIPRSKFVHAALHEIGGNLSAELLNEHGYYKGKVIEHQAFYAFLIQQSNGQTIDFMTIDTEGGEFSLLKTIHYEHSIFSKICQFNMEIHYAKKHYEVTLDEFDKLLGDFLEEARFVLLNVGYRGLYLRQLFFVNIADPECIQRFLC